MATITCLEPGTDATGDLAFWGGAATDASSATDQVFAGTRSLKLTTNNPAVDVDVEIPKSILADAGSAISFYMRIDTLPAAVGSIAEIRTAASLAVARLQLNPNGTITLLPVGATAVTGSTVIANNTWPRFAGAFTITSTTTFRFDCYGNGTLQGSATAGTLYNQLINCNAYYIPPLLPIDRCSSAAVA